MSGLEWGPIAITLRLAAVTTFLLLLVAVPLAWWLSRTRSPFKPLIEAVTALPLVLPPTVLGFYLLLTFSPRAPLGRFWVELTGETLSFSFSGLVVASLLYSLPFAVQPLQGAFEAVGREPLEAAASLGASPVDAFFSVALPSARRGLLTAAVLSFAHTVGEFGVVLMVGGSIPGRTQVVSIRLYEHVETLNYKAAHAYAAGLIAFALVTLLAVYSLDRRSRIRAG